MLFAAAKVQASPIITRKNIAERMKRALEWIIRERVRVIKWKTICFVYNMLHISPYCEHTQHTTCVCTMPWINRWKSDIFQNNRHTSGVTNDWVTFFLLSCLFAWYLESCNFHFTFTSASHSLSSDDDVAYEKTHRRIFLLFASRVRAAAAPSSLSILMHIFSSFWWEKWRKMKEKRFSLQQT